MNQYEHTLVALKRLLDAVGVRQWSDWIETDIEHWRADKDTAHHLSAYGAMGSINDVWVLKANKHDVTEAQEPWVNALFQWMKSVCRHLAQHPAGSFSADKLARATGKLDSVLAAFEGGKDAPDSMRELVINGPELGGWRCLGCGYSEVTETEAEVFVADDVVPDLVFRSCEGLRLDTLVDQVLAGDIAGLQDRRKELKAAIRSSDILLSNREGWMRPCPACGRNETAVYRWRFMPGGAPPLVPSDDNLPLRN